MNICLHFNNKKEQFKDEQDVLRTIKKLESTVCGTGRWCCGLSLMAERPAVVGAVWIVTQSHS